MCATDLRSKLDHAERNKGREQKGGERMGEVVRRHETRDGDSWMRGRVDQRSKEERAARTFVIISIRSIITLIGFQL